eukprot:336025-Pelagomonas_calceolata.AAC.1
MDMPMCFPCSAADSATYPLHWIYDVSKVKELLSGKEDCPEFYPTPSCPFYNSGPVGVQSCYGDGETFHLQLGMQLLASG